MDGTLAPLGCVGKHAQHLPSIGGRSAVLAILHAPAERGTAITGFSYGEAWAVGILAARFDNVTCGKEVNFVCCKCFLHCGSLIPEPDGIPLAVRLFFLK